MVNRRTLDDRMDAWIHRGIRRAIKKGKKTKLNHLSSFKIDTNEEPKHKTFFTL